MKNQENTTLSEQFQHPIETKIDTHNTQARWIPFITLRCLLYNYRSHNTYIHTYIATYIDIRIQSHIINCTFRIRDEYIHRLQKEVNNLNETNESERRMRIEKEKKQVLYIFCHNKMSEA